MSEINAQLLIYKSAGAMLRSLVQRGLKQFALGQNSQGNRSIVYARKAYDKWGKERTNFPTFKNQ